jgi:hypothetical protein
MSQMCRRFGIRNISYPSLQCCPENRPWNLARLWCVENPNCLDSRLTDGGDGAGNLRFHHALILGNIAFLLLLLISDRGWLNQGLAQLKELGKLNKIQIIWSRSHDLSAWDLVPQAEFCGCQLQSKLSINIEGWILSECWVFNRYIFISIFSIGTINGMTSEFLAANPEVPGSISGATRFSE